jgi:hypothetical protein
MGPEERDICAGRELLINGKPYPYDRNLYLDTWAQQRARQIRAESGEADLDALRSKHPCVYLEFEAPGSTPCGCGGSTTKKVAVHGCKLHGRCTVCHPSATEKDLRCCKSIAEGRPQFCADFKPDTSFGLTCLNNGMTDFPALGPQLTLGMAVGDGEQFSAVWAAIHGNLISSLDLAVKSAMQVLVVDCTTDAGFREELRRHVEYLEVGGKRVGKYIHYQGDAGTSGPRNAVFENADGKAVVCIDPHIVLYNGCLQSVYNYFSADPLSNDMLVGPCVFRNVTANGCEHQELKWGGFEKGKPSGAFGVWAHKPEMNGSMAEFEVQQQGLGFFASTKAAWLRHGGFHKAAKGFGGCETYLCEKVRRFGGRVLCSNARKWHHRFVDTSKVSVRKWASPQDQTYHNYLLGFAELGHEEWLTSCIKTNKCILNRQQVVSGLMTFARQPGSKVTPEMLQRLLAVANSDT